jgi:hypothetical protein
MKVQTKRQTIWVLYVQGGRHLPFMVIHKGKTHWNHYVILSIHRKWKVGKIDKVTMVHATFDEESRRYVMMDEDQELNGLGRAMNGYKTHELNSERGALTLLCKHFAEPIWYRIGKGWRIVTVSEGHPEEDAERSREAQHEVLQKVLDEKVESATLDL